jgi:hypothetical protein
LHGERLPRASLTVRQQTAMVAFQEALGDGLPDPFKYSFLHTTRAFRTVSSNKTFNEDATSDEIFGPSSEAKSFVRPQGVANLRVVVIHHMVEGIMFLVDNH